MGWGEGRLSRDLQVFPAGGQREQLWHRQGCPPFDLVHPAFSLPTTTSPTLQGDPGPKYGFGQTVVECDRPEPREFPSLDQFQKRFLAGHREADLAAHPVFSLVLQV